MLCRTEHSHNLLPFTVNEWNKLVSDIKGSDSHAIFLKKILALIRPVRNSMYDIFDSFRLDYLIDFVWIAAIYENISLDIILPILWTRYAHTLLKLKIQTISFYATGVILHGFKNFDDVNDSQIITATIKFIKTTKHFEGALI